MVLNSVTNSDNKLVQSVTEEHQVVNYHNLLSWSSHNLNSRSLLHHSLDRWLLHVLDSRGRLLHVLNLGLLLDVLDSGCGLLLDVLDGGLLLLHVLDRGSSLLLHVLVVGGSSWRLNILVASRSGS